MIDNKFFDAFANLGTNEAFKWRSYFKAYNELLSRFLPLNDLKILEIGVSKGGSLDMWASLFNSTATIVGIDIDPKCLSSVHPANVQVHMVDQTDIITLQALANTYGGFDIIIDDGAHTDTAIKASLLGLWPYLKENGVYLVEDIHGTFWGDEWKAEDSFLNFIINETLSLQRIGSRNHVHRSSQLGDLESINMHWSICAFIKSKAAQMQKESLKSSNAVVTRHSILND